MSDLPDIPFEEHDAVVQAIAEVALGAGADPDVLGDPWDVNDTIRFLSGYVTDMEKMKAVAARFVKAHRANIVARDALRSHWRGVGEEGIFHGFRNCQEQNPHTGERSGELCDICAGSVPIYAARIAASRERGNALQSLVRLMLKEPRS